jgi:PQQ-dependent dehydrogenase (methanol/ethanol family)
MTKLEILSIAVLTGAIAAALPASAAQTSSVDGWYAPDQATRGKGSYNANCAVCHGSSLQGGAGPALSGASFAAKWRDRPLRDLYTVAHDQMPLTAPGKLPPKTSFDILAYLLSFNGFQASTKAVSASDLDRALTPPQTGKNIAAAVARAPAPPNVAVSQPTTRIVSQAELDSADDDATNWLTYNKGYKGFRFSKLDQINVNNAPQLRAVCVMQLGEVGTFQTGPVIYDGTMYVTTSHGVYALDAASCERRWEYHYSPWAPEVQVNNKGVAIAEGRVIRGTTDGSLLALDAATGKVLWLRKIMDVTKGEFAVAAPLIRNGIVYIGKAGADWGIQGEMMAFRAADGTKVWGTLLLPLKGDPAYATWKNPASIATGGGSTWSSFSLDTEAKLLLVPVGNAAPDYNADPRPGENLYTNSLVALDSETGAIKWWHQLRGANDKDLDTTVVAAFDTPGGLHLAAAAGKDGVLHVVDRTNGALRFKVPVTNQKNLDEPLTAAGVAYCPGGAILNNGPAYSPATNLVYINSQDWCNVGFKRPAKYIAGIQYDGGTGRRDPLDESFGWTTAIDATSGDIKWRYRSPQGIPMLGAVTPTAGNVVFTGDTAGYFLVFNATSGDVLYRFNTGGVLGGGVATYSVKGRQFVAVMSGNTSFHPYKAAGAATVLIFGL